MNQISPDTFEVKNKDLSSYLFGDQFKTKPECEMDGIQYDESTHKLNDDDVDKELLQVIAENVFRKAQMERDYIIFYGKLCEALIVRELELKSLDQTRGNMKNSKFRTQLFEHCKICFQKFFEKEEKKKHTDILNKPADKSAMTREERDKYTDDFERAIIFQTKLFGNIEFVGELYRRKIL